MKTFVDIPLYEWNDITYFTEKDGDAGKLVRNISFDSANGRIMVFNEIRESRHSLGFIKGPNTGISNTEPDEPVTIALEVKEDKYLKRLRGIFQALRKKMDEKRENKEIF